MLNERQVYKAVVAVSCSHAEGSMVVVMVIPFSSDLAGAASGAGCRLLGQAQGHNPDYPTPTDGCRVASSTFARERALDVNQLGMNVNSPIWKCVAGNFLLLPVL